MKIRWKQARPGDVLGIYIGNELYAFMRLMYLSSRYTYYLCEIFNCTSDQFRFTEDILQAPRLMPIVNANWRSYLNQKLWRAEIVHRDESYQVPVDEIRDVRLMNASQAIRFNMDWTPESDQMFVLTEDVFDVQRHAELSKKYASFTLTDNPEELVEEIRNRLGLSPKLNYNNYEERVKSWSWLKSNNVYIGS